MYRQWFTIQKEKYIRLREPTKENGEGENSYSDVDEVRLSEEAMKSTLEKLK